jgi:acetyl-CoA carboxylase carboxyl transferase subunit alpha
VIPEPVGGAHRNPEMAINAIGNVIEKRLDTLLSISKEEIIKQKEDKYLNIG